MAAITSHCLRSGGHSKPAASSVESRRVATAVKNACSDLPLSTSSESHTFSAARVERPRTKRSAEPTACRIDIYLLMVADSLDSHPS